MSKVIFDLDPFINTNPPSHEKLSPDIYPDIHAFSFCQCTMDEIAQQP